MLIQILAEHFLTLDVSPEFLEMFNVVIQLGAMMEFTVTVLEDRPLYANNARRAGAHQVICDSFENGLDQTKGSKDTYFVILTRGHRYDQICLERIAKMPHAYIGMIGSRRTSA